MSEDVNGSTRYFNAETGKIELYFDKDEYAALSDEQKKCLFSAYLWAPSKKAWVSRAKIPNLYRARDVAISLGFVEEEIVGERLSVEKQLEIKRGKAEERAFRYEEYASNAAQRASSLQKELMGYHGDTAFFTQPCSASSSLGKARQRIFDRFDRGIDEYRKSEYYLKRAATANATADMSKLGDREYLHNRITENKKSIRDLRGSIEYYEEVLKAIEQGDLEVRSSYDEAAVKKHLYSTMYLFEDAIDKIAFYLNALDELGGIQFSKDNIRRGYIVKIRGHACQVIKANSKTVLVRTVGLTITYPYAAIQEIIEDKYEAPRDEIEKHPYKEGDILAAHSHVGNAVCRAYQVVSVSEKSIKIRMICLDAQGTPVRDKFVDGAKEFRRLPRISKYTNQWQVFEKDDWQLTPYRVG